MRSRISRDNADAFGPLRAVALSREEVLLLRLFGFAVLCLAEICPEGRAEPPVRRWQVTVDETAGIRRFGYPVSALIPLGDPVPDADHFRLLENGKPVPAQFSSTGDRATGIRTVALDFNVNHAPLEKRSYLVEYDPRREPAAPRKGLRVVVDGDKFRVIHPSDLEFVDHPGIARRRP